MEEVELQREVVKALKAGGGYGLKLSHRFLVGVPDLLVCPAGAGPMVIEVKLCKVKNPKKIRLELTEPQFRHLRSAWTGGMLSGVLSFWGQKPSQLKALMIKTGDLMAIKHVRADEGWSTDPDAYRPVNLDNIGETLSAFYKVNNDSFS